MCMCGWVGVGERGGLVMVAMLGMCVPVHQILSSKLLISAENLQTQ